MKLLLCLMLCGLLHFSCKEKAPEESFTKGAARIGVSDAVFDIARYTARQYGSIHQAATISIWRHSTQSLLDSLLSERVEEILVDRAFSKQESLAFQERQLKLYTYPIAHYPIYLLVRESLAVADLDSSELKRILEGHATSWSEFGGADIPITPYAPQPSEGAWNSLAAYFGEFDSVAAVICSTNLRMMELAQDDPGALLIYSKKTADAVGFKKLKWANGELRIPANAKTIMDSLRWPFMTTFTYATTHMKSDVAAGFLTFLVSNDGQKMIMNEGYRPASVPVRIIQLNSSPENEKDKANVDTSS